MSSTSPILPLSEASSIAGRGDIIVAKLRTEATRQIVGRVVTRTGEKATQFVSQKIELAFDSYLKPVTSTIKTSKQMVEEQAKLLTKEVTQIVLPKGALSKKESPAKTQTKSTGSIEKEKLGLKGSSTKTEITLTDSSIEKEKMGLSGSSTRAELGGGDDFSKPKDITVKIETTGKTEKRAKSKKGSGFDPLSGKLPGDLENIAWHCQQVTQTIFSFREELDKLSDTERSALISQLSPNLNPVIRAAFEKDWKPGDYLSKVDKYAGYILKTSQHLKSLGKEIPLQVLSCVAFAAGKLGKKIDVRTIQTPKNEKLLKALEKVQGKWDEFATRVQKETGLLKEWVVGKGTYYAETTIIQTAKNISSKVIDAPVKYLLNHLTTDFQVIRETLKNADQLLEELPPTKILESVVGSLDEFSTISLDAEKAFTAEVPELESIPPENLESAKERFQLYHIAKQDAFPLPVINEAFSILNDPKHYKTSLKETYSSVLDQAVKTRNPEILKKIDKEFGDFCEKHGLQEASEESLQLLKKAFFVKKLVKGDDERDAIHFLADMILLNPRQSVAETLTSESILKNANNLYVKRELYETIAEKIFPANFKDLLSGLSKLIKFDLEDSLSTYLAKAIVENGLDYLTNPSAISQLLVKILGFDRASFSDFTVGDGSDKEIRERLDQLCQKVNSPEYPAALKALAAQKSAKSPEQLTQETFTKVDEVVQQTAGSLPSLVKRFISPTLSVEKQLTTLSSHKDWGVFMLMVLGKLNSSVQDPASAPTLKLDQITTRLKHIAEKIDPSIAEGIIELEKTVPESLITSQLKKYQNSIDGLRYGGLSTLMENNAQIDQLVALFIDGLSVHSQSRIPFVDFFRYYLGKGNPLIADPDIQQGIGLALFNHAKETAAAIWGATDPTQTANYVQKYIKFLLTQKKEFLLDIIQTAMHDPQKIRNIFIEQGESALQETTQRLNQFLLTPHKLFPLQRLNLESIEDAIEHRNLTISNVQKTLELVAERERLTQAFDSFPDTEISLSRYSKEDLQKMIQETTTEIEDLHPGDNNPETLRLEQDKLKLEHEQLINTKEALKLKIQLSDQNQELTTLYTQQTGSSSLHDSIATIERQIKEINSEIIELDQVILFNKKNNNEEVVLKEQTRREELLDNLNLKQQKVEELRTKLQGLEKQVQEKQPFPMSENLEKLLILKQKLVEMIADPSKDNSASIKELKKEILFLKDKIIVATRKLEEGRQELIGAHVSLASRQKIKFLDMMFQEALLQHHPEKNKGRLDKLHFQMADSYRKLMKSQYQIRTVSQSIGGAEIEKRLSGLGTTAAVLEKEVAEIDKGIALFSAKSQSLLIRKEQFREKQKITGQLKAQIEDVEKGSQLATALIRSDRETLSAARIELTKKDEQIQAYIQAQEGRVPAMLRAFDDVMGLEEDPTLTSLKKDFFSTLEKIKLLEERIETTENLAIDKLKELEKVFGTTDIVTIKSLFDARLAEETVEGEQLEKEQATTPEEQASAKAELIKLEAVKQKKVELGKEVVEEQTELFSQFQGIKYLSSLEETTKQEVA